LTGQAPVASELRAPATDARRAKQAPRQGERHSGRLSGRESGREPMSFSPTSFSPTSFSPTSFSPTTFVVGEKVAEVQDLSLGREERAPVRLFEALELPSGATPGKRERERVCEKECVVPVLPEAHTLSLSLSLSCFLRWMCCRTFHVSLQRMVCTRRLSAHPHNLLTTDQKGHPQPAGKAQPLSSKYGTCKTVKARLWPWLSGKSP